MSTLSFSMMNKVGLLAGYRAIMGLSTKWNRKIHNIVAHSCRCSQGQTVLGFWIQCQKEFCGLCVFPKEKNKSKEAVEMEKAKQYLLVAFLAIAVFGSQLACDESSNSNGAKGNGWLQCKSVTCTYKVSWNGGKKTAVSGVRINRATATPIDGKWVGVK